MKQFLFNPLLLCILGSSLLLFSCDDSAGSDPEVTVRTANGPVAYGGRFSMALDEKYQSLFPSDIVDIGSSNMANQVFEGLLRFNTKTMEVEPALAESYQVDESGTTYRFKLREGVLFHDDPCFKDGKGRTFNAEDVKFSYEFICSKSAEASVFANTFQDRLVGANAYNEGRADHIEGIKIIDDYTIELTIEEPRISFINVLAMPNTSIMAKEAFNTYGKGAYVGTGPFVYNKEGDTEESTTFLRNPDYYRQDSHGNQLPYLDTFQVHYVNSKSKQLKYFRDGKIDVINGLPSEKVVEVLQDQISDFSKKPPKYILDRSPEMITQFYEFNLTREVFKDVRVRKAFNYAINRKKIFQNILSEEGAGPGHRGLVPPAFPNYKTDSIQGYAFDAERARKFLAEAGYPDGKGFPKITIELNSGGTRNSRVAFEIQKQLSRVLNINVEINVVPFAQKIEDAKYGRADIFRSAWVADYPTPESFLWIMYGKNVPEDPAAPSYPNTARYKNPEFDRLFEEGVKAPNAEDAYAKFMQAEQLMMDDAPLIVLWYNENYRLSDSNLQNLNANPMNYLDITEVYVMTPKKPQGANRADSVSGQ